MHPKALESRITKAVQLANRHFSLVGPSDKILVALSGGKDSYAMLWALKWLRAQAQYPFELFAYHLDQGQPGHDVAPIEAHMKASGVPYEVEYQDTYTRVVEKTLPGKIYCSLCSRFRRAILYKAAIRNGCNKVALGHHRDDLIETLLLNILYAGQIKSMPARLVSEGGTHEVIRPLCYVPEAQLIALAQQHAYPIVPCKLCGSQEKQRVYVKKLIKQLSADSPHIAGNLLASLGNVVPSHLMDRDLYPGLRGDVESELSLSQGALRPSDDPSELAQLMAEEDEDNQRAKNLGTARSEAPVKARSSLVQLGAPN